MNETTTKIFPYLERLLDGEEVEWKTLGEVAELVRGNGLSKKDFSEFGVPAIHYGQIYTYYGNETEETLSFVSPRIAKKLQKVYPGNIVITNTSENIEDVCKSVLYSGNVEAVTGGHATIIRPKDYILPKYLVYYTLTLDFFTQKKRLAKGTKVIDVSAKDLAKIIIPVPPLRVQARIVEILDKFTQLEAQLEAELQAELEARRKQYAYYRDQLLNFLQYPPLNVNIEWRTLGEVCESICSGGTPSTEKKQYYQGSIPWLRTQDIDWREVYDTEIKITEEAIANSSAKLIPANCVIVAMYGATAAKACINKIPLTTNQACCNLQVDEKVAHYKYVYYWISNEYERLKAQGEGSQSNLNARKIKSYKIPLPPLSEQRRIVDILDRFDTLTNSISEGLPREIALRRKQYAYYRDALLSFPRPEVSA